MEIIEYKFKEVDNERLLLLLQNKLKSAGVEANFSLSHGQIYCEISKDFITDAIKLLKNGKDLMFNYVKCITGVDYVEHLEVIYSLYSFDNNYSLNLKVKVEAQNPEIESITGIFYGADWFEREIWEFFGINFKGHPCLKTLLLPGDVEGYPLLKSFEINWQEREYIRPKKFE
ncbi:MAG: NADH-quinone oxidoreductase subunit C [Actinobacteria bacterium]|nr:NADH-quinone oxidoreductase subunit C [Actinomycetota bacterium]